MDVVGKTSYTFSLRMVLQNSKENRPFLLKSGCSNGHNDLDKIWPVHKNLDSPQVKRLLLSTVKKHSVQVALIVAERLKLRS